MKKVRFGKLKTVYHGIIFDVKQQLLTFPNGDKHVYEYTYRDDSVVILPFDERGRLVMIREYRSAHDKYVWFLPAGRIVKGRNPRVEAQKELREEAGYRAGVLKLLAKRYPSGHAVYNVYVYAAKDLVYDPLKGDEHLPVKVVPVPLKRAVRMALDGTIPNEFVAFNIIRFEFLKRTGKFKW